MVALAAVTFEGPMGRNFGCVREHGVQLPLRGTVLQSLLYSVSKQGRCILML